MYVYYACPASINSSKMKKRPTITRRYSVNVTRKITMKPVLGGHL